MDTTARICFRLFWILVLLTTWACLLRSDLRLNPLCISVVAKFLLSYSSCLITWTTLVDEETPSCLNQKKSTKGGREGESTHPRIGENPVYRGCRKNFCCGYKLVRVEMVCCSNWCPNYRTKVLFSRHRTWPLPQNAGVFIIFSPLNSRKNIQRMIFCLDLIRSTTFLTFLCNHEVFGWGTKIIESNLTR